MMLIFKAFLAGAIVCISLGSAHADDGYFMIRSAESDGKSFTVTKEVIDKVGTTTFRTTLPGMDENLHQVRGPLLRDLLKEAGISGETATGVALDKYEVDIPVADFDKYSVIAAIEVDGKALSVREKGPAWVVYPVADVVELQKDAIYEARSVWQLKDLIVK
jgi:hypothetical protein